MIGLLNSILLILIFLIRKKRLNLLRRFGWTYLLLAIPTTYGIFLVFQEQKAVQYSIFLGVFLAFLALEWLLDYVLKINFRENWKQNWKWILPYLALYYAMNYGFVVMPGKINMTWGFITLGLFIIQIVANLRSHPKMNS